MSECLTPVYTDSGPRQFIRILVPASLYGFWSPLIEGSSSNRNRSTSNAMFKPGIDTWPRLAELKGSTPGAPPDDLAERNTNTSVQATPGAGELT